MTRHAHTRPAAWGILLALMVLSAPLHAQQGLPQIPQIPAFLPMAHTVPAGEASPIDGEWMITSIGKRIRIQRGRAFAVDSWLHLFVLKVQPMMVVIKDIRRTGRDEYAGQDLPLMGPWTARQQQDGNLAVSVQGALGPVNYTLMPVSLDNPGGGGNGRGDRDRPPRDDDWDRPPRDDDRDRPDYDDEEDYGDEDYDDDEGSDGSTGDDWDNVD